MSVLCSNNVGTTEANLLYSIRIMYGYECDGRDIFMR